MKRYRGQDKRGFALVELIVVLVVLAILAAIFIPSLKGYIDKTRESAAIAECRACVAAAQSIASEAYGAVPLTSDTIQTSQQLGKITILAEAEGQLKAITLSDTSRVTKLVYTAANGLTVTYENGIYTVGDTFRGVTLSDYSSLTGQAKQEAIKANIELLDSVFQDYFTAMLEELFPTAAYHSRQFVTLTNTSGPNEGEHIGAVYDETGKKLNGNTEKITTAKWFYEDSGLVDLGSSYVENTKAYFEEVTVNGTTRYTDTVWYYAFKGVNANTGGSQIWYYVPEADEYTTVKPSGIK